MKPVIIRYSPRQVAMMVHFNLMLSPKRIADSTGTNIGTLQKIAKQKQQPNDAVLEFLELEREGDAFAWTIRA